MNDAAITNPLSEERKNLVSMVVSSLIWVDFLGGDRPGIRNKTSLSGSTNGALPIVRNSYKQSPRDNTIGELRTEEEEVGITGTNHSPNVN